LLAYSTMYKVDIDYAKSVEILNFKGEIEKKTIYVEEIIEKVSEHFKLTKDKIIKGTREKEIVIPRQIAMYLSRKLTDSSLKSIGKIFGKDHSTIIHGHKSVERLIKENNQLKNDVYRVTKQLIGS